MDQGAAQNARRARTSVHQIIGVEIISYPQYIFPAKWTRWVAMNVEDWVDE